ncbi:MAG TPA: GNAT family N-acetyltransferase [Thermomicrobiaceae bacterium]|nr:GNAT family N-acetyltransferase [Thermomicrobiaceae bacterium]
MIQYRESADGVRPEQLRGFFVDPPWPNPPSPETHLRLLRGSDHVVLAVDDAGDRVVGFVTAVSDGVLSAYVPLLEVLPDYRGRGIATELMRRLLARLEGLYMVDLVCDPELEPFYTRLGLRPARAMVRRNVARQSGA